VICANEGCGHDADEHGARGYGACRHGLTNRSALLQGAFEAMGIDTAACCKCKCFRVRPRRATPADTPEKAGGEG